MVKSVVKPVQVFNEPFKLFIISNPESKSKYSPRFLNSFGSFVPTFNPGYPRESSDPIIVSGKCFFSLLKIQYRASEPHMLY